MKWILLILLAAVLVSCDVSSPKEIAESEIRSILDDLELRFPSNNIDDDLDIIMSHYDDDYLHSGSTKSDERERWYILLIDYLELNIEDLTIEIIDDYDAHVSFQMIFSRSDISLEIDVPEEEDYLYYFEIDTMDDHWRIIGNQENE